MVVCFMFPPFLISFLSPIVISATLRHLLNSSLIRPRGLCYSPPAMPGSRVVYSP